MMRLRGLLASTILMVNCALILHTRTIDPTVCIGFVLLNGAAVVAIIPAALGGRSNRFWVKNFSVSLTLCLIGLLPVFTLLLFEL